MKDSVRSARCIFPRPMALSIIDMASTGPPEPLMWLAMMVVTASEVFDSESRPTAVPIAAAFRVFIAAAPRSPMDSMG